MAATVVETLLVEMKARTDQVEQRLAAVERAEGRVIQRSREAGAAATQLGGRYGAASMQIASAAENMARAGKVTGEATKQVLQQGSQMAFMFGPQGAIVGALAIGGLALVQYFQNARKEIEETAKKAREEARKLRSMGREEAAVEFTTLALGDELADSPAQRRGVTALRAERDRLLAELRALGTNSADDDVATRERRNARNSAIGVALTEVRAQLAEIEPRYTALEKRVLTTSTAFVAQEGNRKRAEDAEKARVAAGKQAATDEERLFKAAVDRAKAIADGFRENQDAVAAFGADVEAQLAKLSPSLVDDLTLALQRLDAQAAATGQAADPAFQRLRTALAKQVEDVKALERLGPIFEETETLLASLERRRSAAAADGGKPFTPTDDDLARLERQRATYRAIADDETRGGVVRKAAAEQLLRIELQIAGTRTAGVTATQRLAGGIKSAAQAAYGLVTILKGGNSEIAQMVGGIASAADGISDLSEKAAKAGGFGKLFSTGAGIASAMPAIGSIIGGVGAIASLFGESDESKRIRAENTQAIRDLTVRIGALNANATGQQSARVLTAVSNTLGDPNSRGGFGGMNLLESFVAELAAAGLTLEDVQDEAKRFGVTISSGASRKELEAFLKAADSAGAAFERMQERWRVLGTEQAAQLQEFVTFIAGRVYPQLAGVLRGLDLETPGGRDRAQQTIRDLFSGGSISAEVAEQFLQLLQGTGVDPRGGTGGYQIDRTITEVTGSRLDARLATANVWHERTATGIEALLAAVLGQPLPVLHAPSLPSPGGGAGRPAVAITVQVAAGAFVYTVPGDGRTRTGAEAAGQDLARGISQALQADVDLQRFLRGEEPS